MRIGRNELVKKLKMLKPAISKGKDGLLQGVLFNNGTLIADNAHIRIETNLEYQQSITNDCFVLPLKAIELIENLSTVEIEITHTEKQITVKSGHGTTRFAALNADDFLSAPSVNQEELAQVDAETFMLALSKELYACSDTNNPYTGILVRSQGNGTVDLVGCDGYCLAISNIALDIDVDMIIPKETIKTLLRLGLSGNVKIYQTKNRAVFMTDDYTVYTELLNGNYLDYRKAIPNNAQYRATVDRIELCEIVKRAGLMIGDSKTPIVMTNTEENKISISTNTGFVDFKEEIVYSGTLQDDLEIGLNAKYLYNALHETNDDTVTLEMTTAVQPCVIREYNFTALILPVRL